MKKCLSVVVLAWGLVGCGSGSDEASPGATLDEVCNAASEASLLCDDSTVSSEKCDEMFGALEPTCNKLMLNIYECVVAEEACNEISMARRCEAEIQAYNIVCPPPN